MPNNFLTMDTNFPSFTGEESTAEKLKALQDYLYQLLEQLRYTLNNLDTTNFNQPALNKWEETITEPIKAFVEAETGEVTELIVGEGGISSRISDAERNISQVSQTVDGIGIKVTGGAGEQTTIAITKDGVAASTGILDLTGTVLFSNLSTPGQTIINGGNITTGTISALKMQGNEISGGTVDGALVTSENIATQNGAFSRLVGVQMGQGVVNLTDRSVYASGAETRETVGRLWYDWQNDRVILETPVLDDYPSVLKLQSGSNMSIDAAPGKTLYIGSSSQDGKQTVHIGGVNETDAVTLYGNVRISPDGSNFWSFKTDGIYYNNTKVVNV